MRHRAHRLVPALKSGHSRVATRSHSRGRSERRPGVSVVRRPVSAPPGALAGPPGTAPGVHEEAGRSGVEMLVVLAIVGAVALATVPKAADVLERSGARGAAQQVASTIDLARHYAASNSATYTVTLTGTTIAVGCTATCPPGAPSEPTTAIVDADAGVTTSVPATPIAFGPLGTAVQPGTITVSAPGTPNWEVRVTGAGGVRTCTPSCS